jgi:hypothetical protein
MLWGISYAVEISFAVENSLFCGKLLMKCRIFYAVVPRVPAVYCTVKLRLYCGK